MIQNIDWHLIHDIFFGVSLIITAGLWPIFLFYSVRRIEKGIVSEGKLRPCLWDPIGGRVFFYTWTLTFPNSNFSEMEERLLCTADVMRYAKPQDRVLGMILFTSTHAAIITALIGMAFGINSDSP